MTVGGFWFRCVILTLQSFRLERAKIGREKPACTLMSTSAQCDGFQRCWKAWDILPWVCPRMQTLLLPHRCSCAGWGWQWEHAAWPVLLLGISVCDVPLHVVKTCPESSQIRNVCEVKKTTGRSSQFIGKSASVGNVAVMHLLHPVRYLGKFDVSSGWSFQRPGWSRWCLSL